MALNEYSVTITCPAGSAAEVLQTINLPIPYGLTQTLVYVVNDDANAATATFKLYDKHNNLLYTKGAIAHNATTVDQQQYPMMNGGKIGITPSADPGEGGLILGLYIYWDDNPAIGPAGLSGTSGTSGGSGSSGSSGT